MKNWKTTLGGIVTAVGLFLVTMPNPTLHLIGQVLAPIGAALVGIAATDSTPAA